VVGGYERASATSLYELFENKDPWKVYHLLKENDISYVAYDTLFARLSSLSGESRALCHLFSEVHEATNYNGM